MAADLTAADPVALTVGWLRSDPAAVALHGGPDHVSGLVEAPWPHVHVQPGPGGDLRGLIWDTEQEVTLEVLGDPEGTIGRAALWRLAIGLGQRMVAMVDERAGDSPGVSRCSPSGTLAWSPLTNGQGRWIIGFLLVVHP